MKLGTTRPRRLTPILAAAAVAAAALLLLFRASPHGLAYSRARVPPARPPHVARGPGSPPSFAYWISGTAGEGRRVLRLLAAVYHPRNRYLLHLDAGASREERTELAAAVRAEAAWREFGNVDVVGESYAVDRTGSSVLAAALHGAAVLLRIGADWDWFVTLSSWDYPLVTQDDLLFALSSVPRDLNFIDHSSDLGWKEHDWFEKLIVDSSLYMDKNTEPFSATETRQMPEAFKIFTGSPWVILSRNFTEHCVHGWDNLPRRLLMYFANAAYSMESYFQTVICSSPDFRNTTVNGDLRYFVWDDPPGLEPLVLDESHFHNMALEALDEEARPRPESPAARREPVSDERRVHEFWAAAGFPSPSSRSWERCSSGKQGKDADVSDVCRVELVVEPAPKDRRWRRGPVSSPSGLRLTRSPPRMGAWRGPLPPRRSTPPAVLGELVAKALEDKDCSPAVREPAPQPAAAVLSDPRLAEAVDPGSRGGIRISDDRGGAPVHAVDPDRPCGQKNPRRWYRALWDRAPSSSTQTLDAAPHQFALRPSPPPPPTPPSPPTPFTPASPPGCRFPRSFAAVVASTPTRLMAGVPPRTAPGAGSRGGPARPPTAATHLLQQQSTPGLHQQFPASAPSPIPPINNMSSGSGSGHAAPSFPGGVPMQAPLLNYAPPTGPAPLRPLQQPSRSYGQPAYLPMFQQQFQPPQLMNTQFQPPPMLGAGLPAFQQQGPGQQQQQVQAAQATSHAAPRPKRKKKRTPQPGQQTQQPPMQPFMPPSAQPFMPPSAQPNQTSVQYGQLQQPSFHPQPTFQGQPVFSQGPSDVVVANLSGPAAVPLADGTQQHQPQAGTVPGGKTKSKKVCWNCAVDTHSSKECKVKHYCLICDNFKHPTMQCPTLKLPKPCAFTSGYGTDETMFVQLPDSVYKPHLAPSSSPTALVTIVGDPVPGGCHRELDIQNVSIELSVDLGGTPPWS